MKQTNEWKPWCVSYFLVWSINVNLFPLSLLKKGKKWIFIMENMCKCQIPPKIHIRFDFN
jgi:hypothetical protein